MRSFSAGDFLCRARDASAGIFDSPFGFLERARGGGVIAPGQFTNHARRSIAQFHVGGFDVDHQVAHDFAQANHGKGGEHVEDELGGGAGLEAR